MDHPLEEVLHLHAVLLPYQVVLPLQLLALSCQHPHKFAKLVHSTLSLHRMSPNCPSILEKSLPSSRPILVTNGSKESSMAEGVCSHHLIFKCFDQGHQACQNLINFLNTKPTSKGPSHQNNCKFANLQQTSSNTKKMNVWLRADGSNFKDSTEGMRTLETSSLNHPKRIEASSLDQFSR